DRRRAQMLRPSDRRLGPADDLRDLSAASGPRRFAAATAGGRARAGAQSRRLSPPERLLDRDRRSARGVAISPVSRRSRTSEQGDREPGPMNTVDAIHERIGVHWVPALALRARPE